MTPKPDVLVVGGGAVGAATARALAKAGAGVTLIRDRELPGEAWRASAGMLAAQIEAGPREPLFSLAVAGRAFYAREAAGLRAATGVDIGLTRDGILQIATEESQVDSFKDKVAWQRQQAQQADWLDPQEVKQGWPWLRPGYGGFWSPGDGLVSPERLVAAFLADAERLGARLVEGHVSALWREEGRLAGVVANGERVAAGTVVIAAGAWSGRIEELPRPLSIEPVRGTMFAYDWPSGAKPVTVYGNHCYLLRRGDELLAGATMEYAGFDTGRDATADAALLVRLTEIYPSLAAQTPRRHWSGFRPGSPDGLPIVGPEPRLPGLWYATGHGRNGILLAGITGELLAQGIGGEELPEQLAVVRPERFWE